MTMPTVLAEKAKALIPKFDAVEEREKILKQIDMAELEKTELFSGRILVAKFIRKNVGKILTAQQTQREDGFQCKVGLVLKMGPLAFQNDESHDWKGQSAKVGDWVLFHFSDGHDFDYTPSGSYDRIPCKIINEAHVQMVLTRPDFAY